MREVARARPALQRVLDDARKLSIEDRARLVHTIERELPPPANPERGEWAARDAQEI